MIVYHNLLDNDALPVKANGTLKKLNSLISLKDIESYGFDFKGIEFSELSHHICAMANTSGGYIVLGIDEVKNKETDHFIRFEKKGFALDKRHRIEVEINNARINVDPDPIMEYRNIEDKDNTLYPVIKIENIHAKNRFL
jgi:predicted HTH transcriptional regulator